ncbi:hypothetical protein BH18ACI5_BH18ACI5_30490 [soil metagenome]
MISPCWGELRRLAESAQPPERRHMLHVDRLTPFQTTADKRRDSGNQILEREHMEPGRVAVQRVRPCERCAECSKQVTRMRCSSSISCSSVLPSVASGWTWCWRNDCDSDSGMEAKLSTTKSMSFRRRRSIGCSWARSCASIASPPVSAHRRPWQITAATTAVARRASAASNRLANTAHDIAHWSWPADNVVSEGRGALALRCTIMPDMA